MFGLTLPTVTGATALIDIRPQRRARLLAVFAAARVLETFLVSLQVWRRAPSHFNLETPFDTTISMTLAVRGASLIIVVLAFTIAALGTSTSPAMQLALRYGFVVLLGALTVGAAMIERGVSLARTGHQQQAYSDGGTLKPLHAITMHATLVLPAMATVRLSI